MPLRSKTAFNPSPFTLSKVSFILYMFLLCEMVIKYKVKGGVKGGVKGEGWGEGWGEGLDVKRLT